MVKHGCRESLTIERALAPLPMQLQLCCQGVNHFRINGKHLIQNGRGTVKLRQKRLQFCGLDDGQQITVIGL